MIPLVLQLSFFFFIKIAYNTRLWGYVAKKNSFIVGEKFHCQKNSFSVKKQPLLPLE